MFSDGRNVFEGDELKGRYSILLHFGKYILHEIAMSSYLDCSHDLPQQNILDLPSAGGLAALAQPLNIYIYIYIYIYTWFCLGNSQGNCINSFLHVLCAFCICLGYIFE